jgi:hypothetical protein
MRQNDYYGLMLPATELYEEIIYFLQPVPRANRQENVRILLKQDYVDSRVPCYQIYGLK